MLLDTKFRFESKQPAMSYVSSLSECMSQYPPELIIAGRSLIFDFVPGGIRDVLSRMVPSNVMVIVAQKCFKGKTDKVSFFLSIPHCFLLEIFASFRNGRLFTRRHHYPATDGRFEIVGDMAGPAYPAKVGWLLL